MSFSKAVINKNLNAFLDMLAWSEGTSSLKNSDDGYNVLFGNKLFNSYHDHPRVLTEFTDKAGRKLKSSAAGRYQEKQGNYDYYKKLLKLEDFSPLNQDLIATQHIKECSALQDVLDGRFEKAVEKCKNIWASLPGAGYSQQERKMEDLKRIYEQAGGTFAV